MWSQLQKRELIRRRPRSDRWMLTNAIHSVQLTKVFRSPNLTEVFNKSHKHLAVNRLCLNVIRGECFGILGVNCYRNITFSFDWIYRYQREPLWTSCRSEQTYIYKILKYIGYCPKFEAFFNKLTPRKHT